MVLSVADTLQHLTQLAIIDEDAYPSIRTIAGNTAIATGLRELELSDDSYVLTTADLWIFRSLSQLRRLSLACASTAGGSTAAGAPADLGQNPSLLGALSLKTCSSQADASFAAVFPVSLTSFTALSFICSHPDPEDPLSADHEQQQRQALVRAASALTNLRRLDTKYLLLGAKAQRAVLGALQQLNALKLRYHEEALFTI